MYLYNMAESKVMEGVRESLRSNHGTVRGLFQAWDTNRDGVLEPSELSHAVCGNNAPVEATSSLFSSLASNGRLGIEYADLYHVLKQGGTTTSSTGRERRASLHDFQDATFTERHESELEAWIEDEVKMNQAAHHAAHDLRQPVPDFSWLRITK